MIYVAHLTDFEGDIFIGVFSTEELAIKEALRKMPKYHYDNLVRFTYNVTISRGEVNRTFEEIKYIPRFNLKVDFHLDDDFNFVGETNGLSATGRTKDIVFQELIRQYLGEL